MSSVESVVERRRKSKWSKAQKRLAKQTQQRKSEERLRILNELFLYPRPEVVSWEKAAKELQINIAGLSRADARAKVNNFLRQVLENYDRARRSTAQKNSLGHGLAGAPYKNGSSGISVGKLSIFQEEKHLPKPSVCFFATNRKATEGSANAYKDSPK